MTHPLCERLRSLHDDALQLRYGRPCPVETFAELERLVGVRLPDDYRAVMLELGGFQVRGPSLFMILMSGPDLVLDLDDDFMTSGPMPGTLMFGNDNGDYGYYFDVHNRLRRGEFALYFVSRGIMTFEASRFVAPTLTEAVDQLLAGDNFRDRPRLG